MLRVNAFPTCLGLSQIEITFDMRNVYTLMHAECNGYIVGNWNLVKLLLSSKQIERYRVRKRTCILARDCLYIV